MSAADDDGAGPDEHAEALAFFDRETTEEVAVPIDDRARRSSPPPAVAVAPALEIGPALPSISTSAPTRTYSVVATDDDAPPSDLLEQLRRSDAPTEEHETVVPAPTRPLALASATPTQVGLPRIHAPESPRPVDSERPDPREPEPALHATARPLAARSPRPRRQMPRVDSGVLRAHEDPSPRRFGPLFAALALALVAVTVVAALLR